MVTGLTIDPLHTMIDGAFGKRIEGFASIPLEGKLSPPLLAVVDQRIKILKSYLKQKNLTEQLKNQIPGSA
jgi:hypothetical protein